MDKWSGLFHEFNVCEYINKQEREIVYPSQRSDYFPFNDRVFGETDRDESFVFFCVESEY